MREKIDRLAEKVKERLFKESTGHDWYHTERVYKNAKKIAEKTEGELDLYLIEISALLHDIADHKFGYSSEDRKNIIKNLFEECELSEEIFEKVVDIVEKISFSKGNIPESLEGKIIQDADRLDAIGAIGIARTFAFGGSKNRPIYTPEDSRGLDSISHFYDKLLKIKDLMNTEQGRVLAKERDRVLREFLDNFYREWEVN